MECDAYLLELACYVVLNPVRAGMVRAAEDWAWSSYGERVGQASAPVWLETDWLLGQFGEERADAQAAYADFVGQGVGGANIWDDLHHQVFRGGEGFVERQWAATKPLEFLREVPRAASAAGAAPCRARASLPGPRRGHGSGLRNRRLWDAGDRSVLRRARLDSEPCCGTISGEIECVLARPEPNPADLSRNWCR